MQKSRCSRVNQGQRFVFYTCEATKTPEIVCLLFIALFRQFLACFSPLHHRYTDVVSRVNIEYIGCWLAVRWLLTNVYRPLYDRCIAVFSRVHRQLRVFALWLKITAFYGFLTALYRVLLEFGICRFFGLLSSFSRASFSLHPWFRQKILVVLSLFAFCSSIKNLCSK